MPSERKSVSTRHGPLAYSVLGEGPPLYLLPANGHAARDFDSIRVKLSTRFETIAIDWPSMGESPPAREPSSVTASELAEQLEDVTSELDRGPSLVIGHSVGGFAAARLALTRPSRVAALVLVDTGGFSQMRAPEKLFCRVKGTALATRFGESTFARWHTTTRNDGTRAMFERIEQARRDGAYAATVAAIWRSFAHPDSDLCDQAQGITCPTLVVWGALDPVLPLGSAGRTAFESIPGAERAILQTGHSPFVEDPDGFLGHVWPFLKAKMRQETRSAARRAAQ